VFSLDTPAGRPQASLRDCKRAVPGAADGRGAALRRAGRTRRRNRGGEHEPAAFDLPQRRPPAEAGEKIAGLLSHLCINAIFLPRQARDKHRETTQKRTVLGLSGGYARLHPGRTRASRLPLAATARRAEWL
jgi:hypothetical protein